MRVRPQMERVDVGAPDLVDKFLVGRVSEEGAQGKTAAPRPQQEP
jgi:hypothetical protein